MVNWSNIFKTLGGAAAGAGIGAGLSALSGNDILGGALSGGMMGGVVSSPYMRNKKKETVDTDTSFVNNLLSNYSSISPDSNQLSRYGDMAYLIPNKIDKNATPGSVNYMKLFGGY